MYKRQALGALNGVEKWEDKVMELMDAVDNWIPLPPRDVDKPFLMPVDVYKRQIKDYNELKTLLDRFRTDDVFMRETGANAGYYVTSNAGATEKIMPVSYTHLDVYKRQCLDRH